MDIERVPDQGALLKWIFDDPETLNKPFRPDFLKTIEQVTTCLIVEETPQQEAVL